MFLSPKTWRPPSTFRLMLSKFPATNSKKNAFQFCTPGLAVLRVHVSMGFRYGRAVFILVTYEAAVADDTDVDVDVGEVFLGKTETLSLHRYPELLGDHYPNPPPLRSPTSPKVDVNSPKLLSYMMPTLVRFSWLTMSRMLCSITLDGGCMFTEVLYISESSSNDGSTADTCAIPVGLGILGQINDLLF